MDVLEQFKDTWLWQGPSALVDSLGWLLVPIAVAVALVIVGLAMLRYVARGGGQYGIIEGYVGTIGAGKTTLAVQHALMLARARGAVLLSNIPVICGPACLRAPCTNAEHELGTAPPGKRVKVCKLVHACAIDHALLPMNDDGVDLADLTRRAFVLRDEGRGLVLLMDEVGVVMPARLWREFSVALMWVLQQSRKLACEWIWTAQDASFVDHQLRSLTSVVHYVRAYPPPSIWRRVKGKRPWLLVASAYTPGQAPRANGEEGARGKERRIGRRMTRYRRKWEGSFDTDGVVLPSRHLKGAEVLREAVLASGDAHVMAMGAEWGELAQASPEPGQLPAVTG
jgi:hypothetical protein